LVAIKNKETPLKKQKLFQLELRILESHIEIKQDSGARL
jgi:hypothetical protein